MERAKRIELSSQPWQGRVLPLNHARKSGKLLYVYYNKFTVANTTLFFGPAFFSGRRLLFGRGGCGGFWGRGGLRLRLGQRQQRIRNGF